MMRVRLFFVLAVVVSGVTAADEPPADLSAGKPRALALAKRRDLESSSEHRAREARERQTESIRTAERMRRLPTPVAYALAHGRIRQEEIVFDSDGTVVETPALAAVLSETPRKESSAGSVWLRLGGLSLGVVLILLGILAGRRRRIGGPEAASPHETMRDRVHTLED